MELISDAIASRLNTGRRSVGYWTYHDAAVIGPLRTTAVLSETAETEPTQRDRHLLGFAETGRLGLQKASGDISK